MRRDSRELGREKGEREAKLLSPWNEGVRVSAPRLSAGNEMFRGYGVRGGYAAMERIEGGAAETEPPQSGPPRRCRCAATNRVPNKRQPTKNQSTHTLLSVSTHDIGRC